MQPTVQVNPNENSQNIVPPPAYSIHDPVQASSGFQPNLNTSGIPSDQSTTQIHLANRRAQGIVTEQNQFYNAQTGNNAKVNSAVQINQTNPFVYKKSDAESNSKPVVKQRASYTSVQQQPTLMHSSSYDSTNNPYIWTNKTNNLEAKISNEIAGFEQKLSKIKEDISVIKSDAAVMLNKELSKNKSIVEIRKLLVNNEYLSDIHVILESKAYPAHKLFLITASQLFYQHFQIDGKNEITVEGIDEETLLTALTFCYTGNLPKLTDDNVLRILLASDKLKISQAYNICCGYITAQINANGVFIILEKAIDLKNELFQKKCLDYIKKNEAKCFNSNGFFNIGLPSLIAILGKCDYQNDKKQEIIEKWNHGPVKPEIMTLNVNNKDSSNQADKTKNQPKDKNTKEPKQQQQPSKSPNKNENQILKNRQQANKKRMPQNASNQSIPNFGIPPPPFKEGFHNSSSSAMAGFTNSLKRYNSMGSFSDDLICFAIDDNNDLVCVDDDKDGKIRINVKGIESIKNTEFSRIDFIAKRSFLLHEFGFNDDILTKCTEIKIQVSTFEGDSRSDVHTRTIKKQSSKFVYL